MGGISRSAGYVAGAGKEEGALHVFEMFLEEQFKASATRITEALENYEYGDFRFESGNTVECKGQPIDPTVFRRNFVEVFEDTARGAQARHASGFSAVADALGVESEALAALRVTANPKRSRLQSRPSLGRLPFVSASIHTFVRAAGVAYVNAGKEVIALYEGKQLLALVREAMTQDGLMRGAGRSNDDTFSVFVPYPTLIWARMGASCVFRSSRSRVSREAGQSFRSKAFRCFGPVRSATSGRDTGSVDVELLGGG